MCFGDILESVCLSVSLFVHSCDHVSVKNTLFCQSGGRGIQSHLKTVLKQRAFENIVGKGEKTEKEKMQIE